MILPPQSRGEMSSLARQYSSLFGGFRCYQLSKSNAEDVFPSNNSELHSGGKSLIFAFLQGVSSSGGAAEVLVAGIYDLHVLGMMGAVARSLKASKELGLARRHRLCPMNTDMN